MLPTLVLAIRIPAVKDITSKTSRNLQKWGFDYLKIDYCGAGEENLDAAHQYEEIARALAHAEAATGHMMLLSICAGKSDPWMWAPNVGGLLTDIWRTGSDIVGPVVAGTPNAYKSMTCTKSCPREASFQRVLRNFDQGIHAEAQHTGFYNDPDMMILGMPGLSDTENRVHMSLWVMSGSATDCGRGSYCVECAEPECSNQCRCS